MEFPGVLTNHVQFPYGSWFLSLEFLTGVIQFCRISGESLVSLEFSKVKWQILKFQGFFKKVYLQSPMWIFCLEYPISCVYEVMLMVTLILTNFWKSKRTTQSFWIKLKINAFLSIYVNFCQLLCLFTLNLSILFYVSTNWT